MTEGWQPIETAPKDGGWIDLWVRDVGTGLCYRFPDCRWSHEHQQWHGQAELIWPDVDVPTHWMYPPNAPA